jgi:hypothetical protein
MSMVRALRPVLAALLAAALVVCLPACKRNPSGDLPATSGEAIQAKREEVKGFAVVRAYPDQGRDTLAIAVEFSRPLVGTQDFDKLLTFDRPPATRKAVGRWTTTARSCASRTSNPTRPTPSPSPLH